MQELYDKTDAKKNISRMNAGVPWSKYNALNQGRMISYKEIIEKIVAVSKFNLKLAAFFSVLYITGSRINEILKYKYKGKKEEYIGITKPGLTFKNIDFEIDPEDESEWIMITSRVEKSKAVDKIFHKIAWTEYDEENYIFPLIQILETYLEQNFKDEEKDSEVQLFTFSYQYAHVVLGKYLKMNPHFVRDLRARHLVAYDGFTPQDLKKFFGWHTIYMPMYYSRSEESIIKNRLRKII